MASIEVVHFHNELSIGGTEKSVEVIVRNLSDNIHSTVICLDGPGIRGKNLIEDGYDIKVIRSLDSIRSFLEEREVDIVHVHGGFDRGTDVISIATEEGVPAIFKSLHFGKPNDRNVSEHVDHYFFVSKMILLRYLLLNEISLEPERWSDDHEVLYNPIDLSTLDSENPSYYRNKFDIPDTAPVLGKIGRSAPEKWGKISIQAFEKVLERRPDTHLLLVNTPEKIRQEIRLRGLEDSVHYEDEIPLGQISRFYNSIDVLAHSSAIGETLGYVIIEAMAHETPVVVNSQPMRDNGQIEVVENDKQGYVANGPGNFAAAINELLNNPDKADKMGSAGKTRVERMFSAETVTDRLESFYWNELSKEKDNCPAPTDLRAFRDEYQRRLKRSHGESPWIYTLERWCWIGVTKWLPVGRSAVYEFARKGFLFRDEYL